MKGIPLQHRPFWGQFFRRVRAMDDTTGDQLWVEHWQRVGPMLEKIEQDELRSFCFKDNWERIDGLFQFACDQPSAKDRHTSGLVEQQRYFSQSRR